MKTAQKAKKVSILLLALLTANTLVTHTKDANNFISVHEQKNALNNVIGIFGPFFTDPGLTEIRPFKEMCREAIPHMKKAGDKDLLNLAHALEKVCAQEIITVQSLVTALIKYAGSIKKHFGNMLPIAILNARLNQALTLS